MMKKFKLIIPILLIFFLFGCKTFLETNGSGNSHELITGYPSHTIENGVGAEHIRVIDGMTMVYVPEGHFAMGNDGSDTCPYASPAHNVSLNAFWIDKVEVTNEMFTQFLNDQGNQLQNNVKWFEPGAGHQGITYGYIKEDDGRFIIQEGYENYPVIEVSWYGAAAYCSWIGGRLPTEAE